ncbi:MAG: 16S rRNA (guanine(527)-N(7))-methyltransferase RsmG [Clostridia bacterium]|nr:16S rRNA (guanine(527)-N(7))-methyltransferase RsmG [Clostridia bacterium]
MRRIESAPAFDLYYELLIEWNERINLTSITERRAVYEKHFLDSLQAEPYLPQGCRVADIGTGAGFPGVPLLIVRPDLKLTLVDSLKKRLFFLEELLKRLNLNAELIHARAEDLGRNPNYREGFDYTLTRAVAPLPTLMELTVPLLKVGGTSVCYKGNASDELLSAKNAEAKLKCSLETVRLDADYGARSLVFARKLAPTPAQYPRKAGTPSRSPL